MSNQNSKQPTAEELKKAAETKKAADLATKTAQEGEANAETGSEEKTETEDWKSPLDVNYKELEVLLGEQSLADYVGDRLPDEEVKRIETDYAIYLKNKK